MNKPRFNGASRITRLSRVRELVEDYHRLLSARGLTDDQIRMQGLIDFVDLLLRVPEQRARIKYWKEFCVRAGIGVYGGRS